MLYEDVFSIRKNAQFRQWRGHMGELLAKRHQSMPQPAGGHSFFNQLLDRAKADQIAEVVKTASFFFSRRNEAQAVPVIQLLPGQTHDPLHVFRAESVHGTHWKLAGGLFSRLLLNHWNWLQRASRRRFPHRRRRGSSSRSLLLREAPC